ncbi:MAG: MFS transporter, partial [Stellaceae bacterium]
MSTEASVEPGGSRVAEATIFSVILALSFSHFLNDTMQSLVPALYPMLKDSYGLSFAQVGLITLVMQVTSSLLQPVVGLVADHRPRPYSLSAGMASTFVGLLLLAHASNFHLLLLAAAMVGVGSAVFHPEASRVARMASGGRHGLAQSVFQVGGNIGSSLGPILAAFIVIPKGQGSIGWFSLAALLAMTVLFPVGSWYRRERTAPPRPRPAHAIGRPSLSRRKIGWALVILLVLVFSKAFYTTSLNTFYTFYLMSKF